MRTIRLWKTYCQDEGVRLLCTFLERCNSIVALDLLDNKITHLGCEQLGRTLSPIEPCPPIMQLKLDHNPFGSEGMNALLKGIHMNQHLTELSFTYCELDAGCSRALFEMLIYSKSKIEKLWLQGNSFRKEGVKEILQGVSVNKSLKEVSLADN